MKKRILFITHQTSSSGAPLILLYLVRWIRKNISSVEIHTHTLSSGIIENELNEN